MKNFQLSSLISYTSSVTGNILHGEKNFFLAIISTFLRLRDVKCQNDHSELARYC